MFSLFLSLPVSCSTGSVKEQDADCPEEAGRKDDNYFALPHFMENLMEQK